MKAPSIEMFVLLLALTGAFTAVVSAQESSTTEVFDRESSNAEWTKSPSAFRGVPFGGTEAEMVAALGPVKCHDTGGAASVRECRANKKESRMVVNGVTIEDFYRFRSGKLVEIELMPQKTLGQWAPAPSYASVLSAFSEKYGPPTETWKTRYKGVRSLNHTLAGQPLGPYVPYESISLSAKWHNDQLSIKITGYDDTGFAYAFIQTGAWLREREALSKKPTTAF